MYLKSLTLKGFKSFADKTRMVFDPGLTVVVGPNGSGKSNISDAILWVLGEQSAKHLRGSAMEDVIFAGSTGRAAVSVAEVTLVLDNADHTLPIDFAEVAVTRRMYRSGESEYLVNASPARLMDVQDILHDSGLGRQTHSIISQGKLDEVLMSRPEERRALIEEAAGISKHKRRRERSLRRLASMDEYLKRAQDMQRTLERQIRPLERQVERAQRYEAAAARAGELKVSLAVDDLRRLRVRWADVEREQAAAASELARAETRVGERQVELERLQGLLDAKGLFAGDISEQRRRCASLVERLDALHTLLGEKGRHLAQRTDELDASAERARGRERDCARELDDAGAQATSAARELAELEERKRRADEGLAQARDARRAAEAESSRVSARSRDLSRTRDAASVALARARDVLENAREASELVCARLAQMDEARTHLEADLARAHAHAVETEQACKDADEALGRARADVEAKRLSAADAQSSASAREAALERVRADEVAARAELTSRDAEADGLERALAASRDSEPLAASLARDERVRAACVGRVTDALDVPPELVGLAETLLGPRAAGFVVRDEATLADVARAMEAHEEDAGFACAVACGEAAAAAAGDDGLAGYDLASRVGEVAGMPGVARALLGDVRVVDDAALALQASAADPTRTYATPAGARARGGRTLSAGRDAPASGAIAASARLRTLASERPALEAATRACARKVEEAATALAQAREQATRASRALAEAQAREQVARSELARATSEHARAGAEVARLEQALESDASARKDVEARRAAQDKRAQDAGREAGELEAKLEGARSALEALDATAREAQEALDAARRQDRVAHEEANDCKVALAAARERERYARDRARQLAGELEGVRASLRDVRAALDRTHVARGRVEPLGQTIAALQEEARAWDTRLEARAKLAEADAASLRDALETARAGLSSARQAYTDALNALNDVKVRKGQLDVQVNGAVNAITSHKGVVLEEALALPAPEDRAADEAELAALERTLEGMGPVNHAASEEYARLRSQADYVGRQVADLRQARASLTKIIGAIDRKMRASFTDTFAAVDANFREMFAMLFPGGSGRLELTDPDDPDATGVEVIAQPRGKRVTKMSLLSGGERSLAALGLLFAVYKTRTVPFYVLDEVEAALDDSNLDKLLGAIDMLRRQTQLIVISHQRRTMERADVLYGVSMQADGVSKVVSQRLGEGPAAARAAAAR